MLVFIVIFKIGVYLYLLNYMIGSDEFYMYLLIKFVYMNPYLTPGQISFSVILTGFIFLLFGFR